MTCAFPEHQVSDGEWGRRHRSKCCSEEKQGSPTELIMKIDVVAGSPGLIITLATQ
jgi:hypothetical protein